MRSRLSILLVALAAANAGAAPPPPPPPAGSIGYRNDTNMAVVVQGSSMNGPRVAQGPLHQINPNESATDLIAQPGVKTITIFDAQQRILHRTQVTAAGKDQYFSIQLELGPDKTVRGAKLVPIAPPGAGPRPR